MAFVKKRLLDVDLKRRNLVENDGDGDGVAMVSRHTRRKITCFRCGKFGHKRADCRVRLLADPDPSEHRQRRFRNSEANVADEEDRCSDRADVVFFATKEEEELGNAEWILDSVATNHMAKDSSVFSVMRRLERPVDVLVANGEKMKADYCGDVVLYATVGNKKKKCEVRNVLYLPGLNCNILSVNRVTRAGLEVTFVGDRTHIVRNGTTMAVGQHNGKQYVLDVLCKCEKDKEVAAMLASTSAS
ncbi:uncharacterized protein LOC134290117 [Aedes albopictus]|uniref:CCHC-type domain-containing protein n=1 Tax=Aedes albopictus TaxID=7160 RepID=A0ABM1XUU2_AEDAL